MGKSRVGITYLLTALLLVVMTGCGHETVVLPGVGVLSTTPAPGATNVAISTTISATFSLPMNPATINTTTFTVTSPSGAVTGAVTYNSTNNVATFTPSANLAYSTVYTGTITTGATDLGGTGMLNNYTWTFTTITPAPTVVSTVPANGATGVPVGQAISATFNEAMNCTTLASPATNFTVTGPGGANVAGSVACAGNVATFTSNAFLAFSTLYTATIKTGATDLAGTGLVSNYTWSFITVPASTPPMVIATVPVNGATSVPVNRAVLATFSEAMTPASINTTTFTLQATGGAAVTGIVTYVASGSTATFTPAANLAASTQYTATITTGVTSLAGTAMTSNYVWTFTTAAAPSTTKPTVISTIPANAATNVPLNQVVSASFSEAMNPATINSSNFTLQVTGGAAVTGVVAYAAVGNTLTFTPATSLAASTQYTATITTGVMDLSGNALASNYIWTFTTGTAASTTKPVIVSTVPANAATGVAINQTVSATFSEAMNPLTITTATFQVTGPSGPAIAGTVSYDPINFIATFTPTASLAASTIYTASIVGATDLNGNTLGSGGVANPWMFTTGTTTLAAPVNLGTAALFGDFGGSAGMTNSGTSTVINGDIGTTGVSTLVVDFHDETVITGGVAECSYTETPIDTGGQVNGNIDTAPGTSQPTAACPNEGTAATAAIAAQAALDATSAYGQLVAFPNGLAVETCPGCGGGNAGELGNRTLAPGIYKSTPGSYAISAGPLTLDAQGNANAFWVFQMASTLKVGTPSANESVVLVNGAQAKNVYWQVGSFATINGILGGGTMQGTIIAQTGASVSTAGVTAITTINGRVLSLGPSVTIVNTVINVPAP
jgi:hypothetical protein